MGSTSSKSSMSEVSLEEVEAHNTLILLRLSLGDLVEFKRGMYAHWAVYVGDGYVVHLEGRENRGSNYYISGSQSVNGNCFDEGTVSRERFLKVAGKTKAKINNKCGLGSPLSPDKIVKNALSKIGPLGFNLFHQNCEHFATWCRFGIAVSEQADNLLIGTAVVAASSGLALVVISISAVV